MQMAPTGGGAGGREDEGAADVRYVEFMGKDNVAFHSVKLPCDDSRLARAVEDGRCAQGLQPP